MPSCIAYGAHSSKVHFSLYCLLWPIHTRTYRMHLSVCLANHTNSMCWVYRISVQFQYVTEIDTNEPTIEATIQRDIEQTPYIHKHIAHTFYNVKYLVYRYSRNGTEWVATQCGKKESAVARKVQRNHLTPSTSSIHSYTVLVIILPLIRQT